MVEFIHGDDNVLLGHIIRKSKLLRFRFTGAGPETPHLLRQRSQTTAQAPARNRLRKQVHQLAAQKLSQRQISARLRISLGKVNKLLKEIT